MKLTIKRPAAFAALARAAHVAEKKSTSLVLTYALFNADATGLTITATDGDLRVAIACPAEIALPGQIAICVHTLHDIAKKLPESAEISLDVEADGWVAVRSGRSRFRIPTLPADTFPAFTSGELGVAFEIAGAELLRMIARVQGAISTDATRYFLNGVYMHGTTYNDAPALRLVATNGHILSIAQSAIDEHATQMPGIIIPTKAVQALKTIASEATGPLRLSATAAHLEVVAGDTVLSTKLIDGTYPDYMRVVPPTGRLVAIADLAPFRDAVDRVSIVGERSKLGASLALQFGDHQVRIETRDPGAGRGEEELPVDYDGEEFRIGFAHTYLLRMLQTIEADTVRMEFDTPGAPGVFRSLAESPELYVLMPMRVAPASETPEG